MTNTLKYQRFKQRKQVAGNPGEIRQMATYHVPFAAAPAVQNTPANRPGLGPVSQNEQSLTDGQGLWPVCGPAGAHPARGFHHFQ